MQSNIMPRSLDGRSGEEAVSDQTLDISAKIMIVYVREYELFMSTFVCTYILFLNYSRIKTI